MIRTFKVVLGRSLIEHCRNQSLDLSTLIYLLLLRGFARILHPGEFIFISDHGFHKMHHSNTIFTFHLIINILLCHCYTKCVLWEVHFKTLSIILQQKVKDGMVIVFIKYRQYQYHIRVLWGCYIYLFRIFLCHLFQVLLSAVCKFLFKPFKSNFFKSH